MDQEKIRSNLLSTDQWVRILYMAAYALGAWVVVVLLCAIIFFQALFVLIGGEVNNKLRDAGLMFSRYILQLLNYMVYATEEKPWPFAPFPESVEQSGQNPAPGTTGSPDQAAAGAGTTQSQSASVPEGAVVNTEAVNVAPLRHTDQNLQSSAPVNETGRPGQSGVVSSASYNLNGTPVVPDIPVLTQPRAENPHKTGQDQNPEQHY